MCVADPVEAPCEPALLEMVTLGVAVVLAWRLTSTPRSWSLIHAMVARANCPVAVGQSPNDVRLQHVLDPVGGRTCGRADASKSSGLNRPRVMRLQVDLESAIKPAKARPHHA